MKTYTKEQLLHYLNVAAKKLRKTPTAQQMDSLEKYPSSSTYRKRFGSWNASLKEADLRINTKNKYSKNELISDIKDLSKKLSRLPRTTDLKKRKWIASYSTYRKYFGSWRTVLKKAGLTKKYRRICDY